MQVSDVFTVDQAAIDELKLEVSAGQQYRITQPVNGVNVHASRIVDGKPAKGRPRRFPVAVVARLMGVEAPAATDSTEDNSDTAEAEADAAAEALSSDVDEEERERRQAAQERVTASTGDDTANNDW